MKKQIKRHKKPIGKRISSVMLSLIVFMSSFIAPVEVVCYSDVVNHNSLIYGQTNNFLDKSFLKTRITPNNEYISIMQEFVEDDVEYVEEEIYEEEEIVEEEDTVGNEEEYEEDNSESVNVSYDVFDLLCRTVQTEVTDDYEGQKNVTYVILNRVYSDRFDNSIEEVLFAPGQFVMVNTSKFWNQEVYDETRAHVAEALNDYIPNVSAGGALYFRSSGYFSWAEYIFTDNVGHNFFK